MAEIISEARRCLKCRNPLCQAGCPVLTPIPTIIQLFLDGKMDEAGKILFDNNPLSALCSLICPHEMNCLGHCILNKKSTPIKFYEIENYISSFYLEKQSHQQVKKMPYLVGIIGAGPAGITLAIILATRGFNVSILDSKDKIGGVLRYGIPDFRLPKNLLDKLLIKMTAMGIKFRPNTLIGPTITIDDMFEDGYDALFIGTGVWSPNRLRIPGETLGNVHFAIDYLKNPDSYTDLGNQVVVIGAGNVAMDAARTIIRKSQSKVNIIFFRGPDAVTANRLEVEFAEVDGVIFNYYLNTIKIEADGIIVQPVIKMFDEESHPYYFNDSEHEYKIPASSIIIAIGQGPQSNIVKNTTKLNTSDKGLLAVDSNGVTTRDGVFAAGDVVSGPKTVVEAVAFTKKVAEEIEKYCINKHLTIKKDLK